MKNHSKFHRLFLGAILILVANNYAMAQSKAEIFNDETPITWLGLDFSQASFIGSATQFGDAGEITNAQFKNKYATAWNQLFIDEPKKYDVALAVHRSEVKYATDITEKVNNAIKNRDFFTNDGDQYKKLDEEKIKALVKRYDFQSKTGIGLLYIVDGLSKVKEEAGVWVTFVDMKSRTVLLTEYETGKAKGFGFKNYWAGAFAAILKNIKSDYKGWKKS